MYPLLLTEETRFCTSYFRLFGEPGKEAKPASNKVIDKAWVRVLWWISAPPLGPAALGVRCTNPPENSHLLVLSILDPVEHVQDHFCCGCHFVNSYFRLDKIKGVLIGERAKRARQSQVCTIENRGYIMVHAISVYSAGVPYAARACHTQRALLQR